MITKPRGTEDILPQDSALWRKVERTAQEVCSLFGYREIRTPVFENTELFRRGVGDTTDVVQKEMYTFEDKGGRSITLRPEGTASLVRSYIEHSLYAEPQPTKLYYLISCYRYEKPQAGRLREFHQFGVECFGGTVPATDAEIISLAMTFLERVGVSGLKLGINSIGCPKCKKEYNAKLREYFEGYRDRLCPTCLERLEKNPMRILDCKSEICGEIAAGAPAMLNYLCEDCAAHMEKTKAYLDGMGIPYTVDPGIVRGLDYYTRTVFEITSDALGAQSAVCGGGRYNGLVEELGGKPTDGMGFAVGLERLLMILRAQGRAESGEQPPRLFVAAVGERAEALAQPLVYELRKRGVSVLADLCGRSVKAQMKYANKLGAQYCIVLGDEEAEKNLVQVKCMESGECTEAALTPEAIRAAVAE